MVIYNRFFIPGKVPSFNELVNFKAIGKRITSGIIMQRGKKKGSYKFNMYNDVKQQWAAKVCDLVKRVGYSPVEACVFNYLMIEETKRRDPSNICSSAIKFIEDGLIKAGVIPDDRWGNILGITTDWIHEKDSPPGVFMVMSNRHMTPDEIRWEWDCYV